MAESGEESGAVVVAYNRLHPLADTYDYCDEERGVGGEYAGGGHGIVTAMEIEGFVDDEIYGASGEIDKRWGGPDADDAEDYAPSESKYTGCETEGGIRA